MHTTSHGCVQAVLCAVTWNAASLLGGLSSSARLWRSKRAMLDRLCSGHDLVLLQEIRGKAEDMLTLPSGFVWLGSFFRASDLDATSRAGGVVVGLRESVPGARTALMVEIGRGRCMAIQLCTEDCAFGVINTHMDPSMRQSARHLFLRSVRDYIDGRLPAPTFAGGGWNFLATDEVRLDVDGGERREGSRISAAFDAMFMDFAECAQEQHTFSRVSGGGENAVYSRLDRWYCNLDPHALGRIVVSVSVVGSLLDANRPSDHLPVWLVWSPRSRRSQRRPLPKETVSHDIFLQVLRDATDALHLIASP